MARNKKDFTPAGFYFPVEQDNRQAKGYFCGILFSHCYMPSKQKQSKAQWNKARVIVNLTVLFEAVCYFGEFWGHESVFWDRLAKCLKYHQNGNSLSMLQSLTEVYCDARLAYLEQHQGQTGPAPPSRLTALADNINGLREWGHKRNMGDWDLLIDGWHDRLEVVLQELEPISAPADHEPKAEQQSLSDNGEGEDLDSSSMGNPLFFFDVSGSKGKKRGPSGDTAIGNSSKRPTLEVDEGSYQLRDPSGEVERLRMEHESRIDAVEAQLKEMREEMSQKFDLQAKESTASLEALQSQLKAMQDQLQVHQVAHAPAAPIPSAPSLDISKGQDLSEMLDYQPQDFVKAVCEELGKLRAITKSKIHQMDKQGLPDDEKKLAISDLSWQIGKCIKVAEKGVGELM